MVIYGVALLAGCMLVGLIIGDVLGQLLGISANLGGVGIAMLLLIFVTGYLKDRGKLPEATESGINFWNAMYIPIVVAMAASQNVAAAFSGGMVAIVAELLALKDRTLGNVTAPACGLHFVDVRFDERFDLPEEPLGPQMLAFRGDWTGDRDLIPDTPLMRRRRVWPKWIDADGNVVDTHPDAHAAESAP